MLFEPWLIGDNIAIIPIDVIDIMRGRIAIPQTEPEPWRRTRGENS